MKIRLLAAVSLLSLPVAVLAQDARPAPNPMPGMQMPGTPSQPAQPQAMGMCGMMNAPAAAPGAAGGCPCCRTMAAASTGAAAPAGGSQTAQMQHGGAAGGGGHAGHGTAAPAAQSDTPATQAFKEINARMHSQMNIPYTNDVDVDFFRNMIPHHQGAVDMAKVVLQHSKEPETRKLAEEVVRTQEAEIAQMRAFLQRKGVKP